MSRRTHRLRVWGMGVALLAGTLCASCGTILMSSPPKEEVAAPANAACSAQVDVAARLYLDAASSTDAGPGPFASGMADLNDDGFVDAVVVGESCDHGRCQVLVLGGTDDGMVLISKGEVPAYRVSASRHTTNGWHDLIVRSDATPSATYSLLRFDGLGYVRDVEGEGTLAPSSPLVKDGVLLLEVHRIDSAVSARLRICSRGL